jgi:hypothetical protein
MFEVSLRYGRHTWNKVNNITRFRGKKSYDEYICTTCGAKGKSYQLGQISFTNAEFKRHELCTNKSQRISIQITHCHACGNEFESMTDNSIHKIVKAPDGKKDGRGEWVMGKTEPVLILFEEFCYKE